MILQQFIPCAQNRVWSSAPSKTVVTGADSFDFWELTKRSHLQTVEDCIRMDDIDFHLDPAKTKI